MYYIYKITNIKTGLCYIGLTNNIKRRKNRHFSDLNRNCHDNSFLQKHYNRDGAENFTFEILYEGNITSKEIGEKEKYYIKLYDSYYNGYNQNEGGDFGPSNGGSHLTKTDIFSILSALEFNEKRNGQVLADIFEVSRTTISRIGKGINHNNIKWEYDSLPIEKRQEIYKIFCDSCDLESKIFTSNKITKKRQLTKEQVFLLLLNEELGRPKTLVYFMKRFNINSSETFYCIFQGKTYQDYNLEYQRLTLGQKEQLATLLSN